MASRRRWGGGGWSEFDAGSLGARFDAALTATFVGSLIRLGNFFPFRGPGALPRRAMPGLYPARFSPGSDLVGVLAVVVRAVAVDDLPRRLAGLEALGGNAGRRVHEVLVGLVELQQHVGHRRALLGGRELRVPGVDIVVGHAGGHGPLAARPAGRAASDGGCA